jgi:acyl-[acyl-carrier-protein]-phospholipid O-acyltransferase/long-chain-fatty-acid--[acyl-carrier-protein] ligase
MGTLRYIVCGAEKLTPNVREACREAFGIEPIEGYGTTECAPMVTLNIPHFRGPGFFQKGLKRGTIGHPIPGVAVRVLDPESGDPVPSGHAGMLQVRGPNIMAGYLNQPEKTAAVLRDGWYETGDIASVDADGFITLVGRLSRFSKIAGEMVPHGVVEEKLQALSGRDEQCLAVVGLPDERKGERLVVLHTLSEAELDALKAGMDQCGLPNLWRPAAYHRIDAIPVLGTGKVDIRSLKQRAAELAG